MNVLIAFIALAVLFGAALALRRFVRGLLGMSNVDVKRELNKIAPIEIIEKQNDLKRRRMKRR